MGRNRDSRNGRDNGRIVMRESTTSAEVAEIRSQRRRGTKIKKGNRMMVALGVVLVLAFFFSAAMFVTVNQEHMHISYILELSRQKMMHFFNFIIGNGAENGINFTTYRYVMIIMAGACLAASGAIYQGTFRNMLASPSTLGVMSGGSVGNVIYVLLFVSAEYTNTTYKELSELLADQNLWQRNLQSLSIIAGCFIAVAIVAGITLTLGRGKMQSMHLILTGMIFSSLTGSFTSIVMYYLTQQNSSDPRIDAIRQLSMGSFAYAYKFDQMIIMAVCLLPCVAILIFLSGKLDLLALGDEQARTMGIRTAPFKLLTIGVSTIMTAVVMGFCGQVGFIGFIIPLAARRLVGPGFRRLLPASMLMGATLLLLIYDLAEWFAMSQYLNVFTSGFGSIVMIIALIRGGGVRRAD